MQFRMQFKSKQNEEERKDLNQNYEKLCDKFFFFLFLISNVSSSWHFAIPQKKTQQMHKRSLNLKLEGTVQSILEELRLNFLNIPETS